MTAVHHHGHYVRVRKFRVIGDNELEDFVIAAAWLLTWLFRLAVVAFFIAGAVEPH
jgi:hypothetical protein